MLNTLNRLQLIARLFIYNYIELIRKLYQHAQNLLNLKYLHYFFYYLLPYKV